MTARRRIAVYSDIEMGAGGELDDFPHSDWLADELVAQSEGPWRDLEVDVVFNGDTFDFLKTPYQGAHPHHVTRGVALAKAATVAEAHPRFFEALRALLAHPVPRRLHFVVGNHDAELVLPEVQGLLHALCGYRDGVLFPGFSTRIGQVHLEHGHQQDPLFRVNPERTTVRWEGQDVLDISWASVALLDAVMPLHRWFYFYDRLRPNARVMELVPELREMLMAVGRHYWTHDFARAFFQSKDPLLRLNWSMVREVFRRFATAYTDVDLDHAWLESTVDAEDATLFVLGHLHRNEIRLHGHKRIQVVGCYRDEYWLGEDGRTYTPLLKPHLEIDLDGDRVVGQQLVEVMGPSRPPECFPESVLDGARRAREVLERLRAQGSSAPPE